MNRYRLINHLMINVDKWPKTFLEAIVMQRLLPGNWDTEIDTNGKFYLKSERHGTLLGTTFERLKKEREIPVPVPAPVPLHVISFIANIKECKERPPEHRIITTNRETFDNLVRDFPAFALRANKGDSTTRYEEVKVVVLNDDIHLITGFISEHSKCFADFLETHNRREDFDSIVQTLIHTDD